MRKHNSQFRQLKQLEDIVAKNNDSLLPYADLYAKRRPVTIIGKFRFNFDLFILMRAELNGVIGSIAQLTNDDALSDKVKRLEADVKVLEEELQQSYELIDQLEFEIEEVSENKNAIQIEDR